MECPKCSAQITGDKCEYCGYVVPKEQRKSEYADEIIDSLGRIAGKMLSEVADGVTNYEKSHSDANTGRKEAAHTVKEVVTKQKRKANHIAGLIIACVVMRAILNTFFVLVNFMTDEMDISTETSEVVQTPAPAKPLPLYGMYRIQNINSEELTALVWLSSTENAQYKLTGQAAEYVTAKPFYDYDGNCYLEAEDGEISVLYKESPDVFVIEELANETYLVTSGNLTFFEVKCEEKLEPGNTYTSCYEWIGDEMEIYRAVEKPMYVPAKMDLQVALKQETSVIEQTGERERTAYFVDVDGIRYVISAEDYAKVIEGEQGQSYMTDEEMGILWLF